MMHKKILFIQSTPYNSKGQPVKKRRLYFVGLALPLLAALTPNHWQIDICLETIEDIPWDTEAQVIAIGGMGHAIVRSKDIAVAFKKRGKTVIMGGYMASMMAEEASQYCDSVVIGDAEPVWRQVIQDLEQGNLQPCYEKPLVDYATPPPRFDLILDKPIGDFLPVQAGRGCPNTCSFCSVYCLYKGRYHQRKLEEVVRDIHQIKTLGFTKFLLLDDNIAANRDYLLSLADAITPLGMKWFSQCDISIGDDPELLKALARSGCIALSFGLESISQESLKAMDKGWADPSRYLALIDNIQRAGIDVSTEMVVGADGDTLATIAETASFIASAGVVVPRFYILTPIPGTLFFNDMKAQGRIVNENIYAYNGTEAVHQPLHMTPEELTQAYWRLYEKVFSFSSILRRTFFRTGALKRLPLTLFYLSVNLYYRYQIKGRIPPNII